jgi:hypothetical protein
MNWEATFSDGGKGYFSNIPQCDVLVEAIENWLETFKEEKDSFWDDIPF